MRCVGRSANRDHEASIVRSRRSNGRKRPISDPSSKEKLNFKDGYVLFSFGAVLLLVAIAQWLFFPNINMNFEPDIFIYIYGAFGAITWFLFKMKLVSSISHIVKVFFLTRFAILVVQVLFFYLGGLYNARNEVNYYEILANVIINPGYFSTYQSIKYGIPPGYQLWLVVYNWLLFNAPVDFLRDMAFSILNVAFEFGTMYVMVKMYNLKTFGNFTRNRKENTKEFFEFGLFFYAASIFNLYYSNVRNFMDAIPIFLGMLGLYYYMNNKHGRASLLLAISTLIKLIPIFWLLLIIMKFLRGRDFKTAFSYILVAALTAGTSFLLSALYFQRNPVQYMFDFFPQMYQWSYDAGSHIELNQAFWFTVYNTTFFYSGMAAIVALSILFVWKEKDGLSIHAFTSITSAYFIFQPWYDQRYLIWILPLLCLDLLSSKRNFGAIISLFYISIFIYLVFMHFPNNLLIDTTITSPTPLVGTLYRLTGQFISYAGFLLVIIFHTRQVFSGKITIAMDAP